MPGLFDFDFDGSAQSVFQVEVVLRQGEYCVDVRLNVGCISAMSVVQKVIVIKCNGV